MATRDSIGLCIFAMGLSGIVASCPARADYGDTTETEVTVKGVKGDNDQYTITFTAINHCHALNLIRVYDKKGTRIFPTEEALGGKAAEENEQYKKEFTAKDPFPVTVDLKEFESRKGYTTSEKKDKKCSATEENEAVDYHRHGPFLDDGTAAAYHGLKAGYRADPNRQIDKEHFNKGPGAYPSGSTGR